MMRTTVHIAPLNAARTAQRAVPTQVAWGQPRCRFGAHADNTQRAFTGLSTAVRRVLILMLLFTLVAALASDLPGQQTPSISQNPLSDLTIFIIRHAEKPDFGSGLTSEGEARARAYVHYFEKFRLDSRPLRLDYLVAADDSEHSQRSRLTLEPLAQAIGLKPDLRFQARQAEDLARELRSHSHGKAVLICWHHHEIPELLKAMGADPDSLLPQGEWPSQQFGWMLELRYDHEGRLIRGKTKRIKEHLMPGD
jgi:hypothetical protein